MDAPEVAASDIEHDRAAGQTSREFRKRLRVRHREVVHGR
jgi:hypothetical protein